MSDHRSSSCVKYKYYYILNIYRMSFKNPATTVDSLNLNQSLKFPPDNNSNSLKRRLLIALLKAWKLTLVNQLLADIQFKAQPCQSSAN